MGGGLKAAACVFRRMVGAPCPAPCLSCDLLLSSWSTGVVGDAGGTKHGVYPLCDIPSGCCSFTGPWTVTHSSLRMLHRVATFCRPLRPVLLLVSFPRSQSPVVGVLGLC